MSAGMFEAINSKLNSSGNEVDFLIILQSRGIIEMNRWLEFIAGNSSPVNMEGIGKTFFFESRVFLVVAAIRGLISCFIAAFKFKV